MVGTTGLIEALRERGLTPVYFADDQPPAVVQGYSPDDRLELLAEGAVAINRGVFWVATNLDPTVPSPRGPLPGNGSLVAALRHATGVEPVATGKPDPTMHRESVERRGAQLRSWSAIGSTPTSRARPRRLRQLARADRGHGPRRLLDASGSQRPTYVAHDAAGLLVAHRAATPDGDAVRCGNWRVDAQGRLARLGPPGANVDGLDALRALCVSRLGGQNGARQAEATKLGARNSRVSGSERVRVPRSALGALRSDQRA